jgi:hypothetical protein
MNPLDMAETYLGYGWSIIPMIPGTKRALVPWIQYRQEFVDAEMLATWRRKFPRASIAIVTGPISDLIVLDVDGPEGEKTLAMNEPIGHTPIVETRKGRHFYLKHPGFDVRNRARFLPGLDIRGDRGLAVAPPSVRSDGGVYRWLVEPCPLAPASDWLLDCIRPKPEPERGPRQAVPIKDSSLLAWAMRQLSEAAEGCRNDTLNRVAYTLGGYIAPGSLTEDTVRWTLKTMARNIGLELRETEATISSGLEKGKLAPL